MKDYLTNVHHSIYHMPTFKESEVEFRAKTLKGIITIMSNDVFAMLDDWNKELNEVAQPNK